MYTQAETRLPTEDKANGQSGESREACAEDEVVVHQHPASTATRASAAKPPSKVAEPDSLAKMFGAALEQAGLLLQSAIELGIFTSTGHYSGDRAGAVYDPRIRFPSRARAPWRSCEQGGSDDCGENRKRAFD